MMTARGTVATSLATSEEPTGIRARSNEGRVLRQKCRGHPLQNGTERAAERGPSIGHGVALRPEHYGHLLEHGPGEVPWFEIISENFFEPGVRPWRVVERLRRDVPIAMHGVSLGLGDTEPLD